MGSDIDQHHRMSPLPMGSFVTAITDGEKYRSLSCGGTSRIDLGTVSLVIMVQALPLDCGRLI